MFLGGGATVSLNYGNNLRYLRTYKRSRTSKGYDVQRRVTARRLHRPFEAEGNLVFTESVVLYPESVANHLPARRPHF